MNQKNGLILTLLVNIIFFIAGLFFLSHFSVTSIQSWVHGFGFIGVFVYVALYFFMFIIPFNPIPKNIAAYFALVSFGPGLALITTLFAGFLGVMANYFIAFRYYNFFPNSLKKGLHRFDDVSFWALLLFRIAPITEGFTGPDFPSYAAGIMKMPLPKFLVATFVPWVIIDAIYFFSLNHFISNKYLILVFIVVIGFSIFQIALKYRSRDAIT